MQGSDGVTWEGCPNCRRIAAVGWVGGFPSAFDCPAGCRPTGEQLRVFAARRARPAALWLTRP
jgi:hypothetical protein